MHAIGDMADLVWTCFVNFFWGVVAGSLLFEKQGGKSHTGTSLFQLFVSPANLELFTGLAIRLCCLYE